MESKKWNLKMESKKSIKWNQRKREDRKWIRRIFGAISANSFPKMINTINYR